MRKLLWLLVFPAFFWAQNADDIIALNIEKTGGASQWMSLHTIQLQGEITLGIADEYPIAIYQKRPNWTLSIIQLKGKSFILEGYNGKIAIQNDFSTGKIVPIPQYKPENFDSDLLNYKAKGFSAEYLGKYKVQGEDCYKVALHKYKISHYYYFSIKSAYLVKEEKEDEILLYSQFKKTNDWVLPYRIESMYPNGETEFVLQIQKILTNQSIPDTYFNF